MSPARALILSQLAPVALDRFSTLIDQALEHLQLGQHRRDQTPSQWRRGLPRLSELCAEAAERGAQLFSCDGKALSRSMQSNATRLRGLLESRGRALQAVTTIDEEIAGCQQLMVDQTSYVVRSLRSKSGDPDNTAERQRQIDLVAAPVFAAVQEGIDDRQDAVRTGRVQREKVEGLKDQVQDLTDEGRDKDLQIRALRGEPVGVDVLRPVLRAAQRRSGRRAPR